MVRVLVFMFTDAGTTPRGHKKAAKNNLDFMHLSCYLTFDLTDLPSAYAKKIFNNEKESLHVCSMMTRMQKTVTLPQLCYCLGRIKGVTGVKRQF